MDFLSHPSPRPSLSREGSPCTPGNQLIPCGLTPPSPFKGGPGWVQKSKSLFLFKIVQSEKTFSIAPIPPPFPLQGREPMHPWVLTDSLYVNSTLPFKGGPGWVQKSRPLSYFLLRIINFKRISTHKCTFNF